MSFVAEASYRFFHQTKDSFTHVFAILRFGEVVSFNFDTHPLTNISDQLIIVIASGFIGPKEFFFNCRLITFQCLEQVLENRNDCIPILGAAIKVMYVRLNGTVYVALLSRWITLPTCQLKPRLPNQSDCFSL